MDADDPTPAADDALYAPPTPAALAAEAARALRGLLEAGAESLPFLPGRPIGETRPTGTAPGPDREPAQAQPMAQAREPSPVPAWEPAPVRPPEPVPAQAWTPDRAHPEGPGEDPFAPPPSPAARPAAFDCDLPSLASLAATCTRCDLHATRRQAVFGEGPAEGGSPVMFVGEGPGAEEDVQGRPFVGPAGQLLDKIIAAMHLSREACYITNVVKCRPPGNATPVPAQSGACRPFLERQIDLVRPRVIVALGAVAGALLTGTPESVIRLRGRWHRWVAGQGDIPLFVTYHPAALLRDPEKKRPVWEDMQKVMARLKAG